MMTRRLLIVGLLLGSVSLASAAEQLDLTTPITTPTITAWKVDELCLNWSESRIRILLKGPNGEQKRWAYEGATALTFMTALNKANLTVTSLHKRILNQLVADGVIAGTVSGIPD